MFATSSPRMHSADTAGSSISSSAATGCSSSSLPFTVPAIKLEDREVAVLDLVDDFTKYLAEIRTDLPHVECRVAGGWVRDKVK